MTLSASVDEPAVLVRPASEPASAIPPAPAPAGKPRQHVHQVDLVRLITFLAVIGVHSLGAFAAADDVGGNAVLAVLHYTREAFFALTGFVLFTTYYDRSPRVRPFLRKRFTLVGVPYLVWTAAYTLPGILAAGLGVAAGTSAMLGHVIRGDGEYHLYFLLVSLQVYLLTPMLLRWIRRCRGHHGLLLTVSAALQVGIDWVVLHGPGQGFVGGYRSHAYVIVITYQFWVLLGAVAAVHRVEIEQFIVRRWRSLTAAVVAVLAATQVWFAWVTSHGTLPATAADVFQPWLIPNFVAVIVAVYLLATAWARRPRRPLAKLVTFGSAASFGIYLVHPAILGWLVPRLNEWMPTSPIGVRALVAVVLTAAGSAIFVAVIRRTPLSLPLCGREWQRPAWWTKAASPRS